MKKLSIIVSIVLFSALSGCGGGAKSAGNNKWLDYGNGLINLTNVHSIRYIEQDLYKHHRYLVKFDNFELKVSETELAEEESNLVKSLDTSDPEYKEIMEEAKAEAIEVWQEKISKINDFVKSSDTYMLL
jgi:hypothetical protein